MNLHLFVDPGAKTGLAFFIDKQLVHSCEADGTKPNELYKLIKNTSEKILLQYSYDCKSCVIEAGFVGINKHSSLKLAERRGIAEAVASLLDYTVDYLFVAEWQPILGKGAKKTTKERSKALASKFTGQSIKNDNIADAICQGLHYLHIPL